MEDVEDIALQDELTTQQTREPGAVRVPACEQRRAGDCDRCKAR
jgi:hypothetical protein